MRRVKLMALVAVLVSPTTAWAGGSATPLDKWTDTPTLQIIRDAKPPYGTWKEEGGTLVAEGKAPCWSTRLLPAGSGGDADLRVRFTVTQSAKKGRQLADNRALAAACRWGFHYGENSPGWDVGVVLRFKDGLSFYRLLLSAHRNEIALWDSTGSFLYVGACPVKLDKAHDLRITCHGAHITATLDGKRVLDCWDRTNPHAEGRFGLSVWQSTVKVDTFDVTPVDADAVRMPKHQPAFSLVKDGRTLWLFDGAEPISRFHKAAGGSNRGALYQDNVKLRPGWLPSYFTWIGPAITPAPDGGAGVMPLVGELPGAFDVKQKGKQLRLAFKTERPGTAKATHDLTVSYDAQRGVYRYQYKSNLTFTADKPIQMHGLELFDPLTYNNRQPGPEVRHRWRWAEHRWQVFQGPKREWTRRPMVDFMPEHNNNELAWPKSLNFLYPDPGACPAFEVALNWPRPQKRFMELGMCLWGYDYHHRVLGSTITVPVGATRPFDVTLTAIPPKEADALFKQADVDARIRKLKTVYVPFDPSGNTFQKTTTLADPSTTMVWQGGEQDTTVGRKDSCSLRIDGPDKAMVHMYQHVIEVAATGWWIRGYFKSKGVGGRGLQLRVKYSYAAKPESLFYIGAQGDSDWRPFSFVTAALKQGDSTTVSFEFDGPGTIWLDDVAFSALKSGEAPKTTTFPIAEDVQPRTDVLIDLPTDRKPGKGVYDVSHNGHSLLLHGDPEWKQEGRRGFLRFDGIDDGGDITLRPILFPVENRARGVRGKTLFQLDAFTYELWIRPRPQKHHNMAVFDFRWSPRMFAYAFKPEKNAFMLAYQIERYKGEKFNFRVPAPLSQWVHVVATHGDGKIALYVNGKLAKQGDYDPKGLPWSFFAYRPNYQLGQHYGQNRYRGDFGPLRLYPRALSAQEVTERYESGWPKK